MRWVRLTLIFLFSLIPTWIHVYSFFSIEHVREVINLTLDNFYYALSQFVFILLAFLISALFWEEIWNQH